MSDSEIPFIEDIQRDETLLKVASEDDHELQQKQKGPNSPKSMYSLSIDQVNNNADELIELRGEGRYFGVADTVSGPICSNCHRRGHIRNKCKVVVCHSCGAVDDHYETQCPKSMVCANCGEKGHFKNQCQKKNKRNFCRNCESNNHSDDRCPSIWRSYIMIPNQNKKIALPLSIYCYNCGAKGHYGDECGEQRSSRIPNFDGSAFSGNNLPKELRGIYFNNLKRNRDSYDDYYSSNASNYHSSKSYDYNSHNDQKYESHSSKDPKKKKAKKSAKSKDNQYKSSHNDQPKNSRTIPTAPSASSYRFSSPPSNPSNYNDSYIQPTKSGQFLPKTTSNRGFTTNNHSNNNDYYENYGNSRNSNYNSIAPSRVGQLPSKPKFQPHRSGLIESSKKSIKKVRNKSKKAFSR